MYWNLIERHKIWCLIIMISRIIFEKNSQELMVKKFLLLNSELKLQAFGLLLVWILKNLWPKWPWDIILIPFEVIFKDIHIINLLLNISSHIDQFYLHTRYIKIIFNVFKSLKKIVLKCKSSKKSLKAGTITYSYGPRFFKIRARTRFSFCI